MVTGDAVTCQNSVNNIMAIQNDSEAIMVLDWLARLAATLCFNTVARCLL